MVWLQLSCISFFPISSKLEKQGFDQSNRIYSACDPKQSIHTAEFETPFSHFIDLDFQIVQGFDLTNFIILAPEDALIQKINNRELFKNILMGAFFFDLN